MSEKFMEIGIIVAFVTIAYVETAKIVGVNNFDKQNNLGLGWHEGGLSKRLYFRVKTFANVVKIAMVTAGNFAI